MQPSLAHLQTPLFVTPRDERKRRFASMPDPLQVSREVDRIFSDIPPTLIPTTTISERKLPEVMLHRLFTLHGRVFTAVEGLHEVVLCVSCYGNIKPGDMAVMLGCNMYHALCSSCSLDHMGVTKHCPSKACWGVEPVLESFYDPDCTPRWFCSLDYRPACGVCGKWAAFAGGGEEDDW